MEKQGAWLKKPAYFSGTACYLTILRTRISRFFQYS